MMGHVTSDQISDFAAVYDDDIELISVKRPHSERLAGLAAETLAAKQLAVKIRWEQGSNDANAAETALSDSVDSSLLRGLSEEITLASNVLIDLLGCERVGIRAATLSAPMCPRFHVDRVPCRLLITISGPGTEWIPSDDVDRDLFADRAADAPPVRFSRDIRQLTTGSWSLLKGGTWDGQYDGVVHRSPRQDSERLLLSFDPIFVEQTG